MKALVSLVVGSRYGERFQRQCYAGWKAYADRHGLDLVLFTEPLDTSPRADRRSVAWQKCLAVADGQVRRYEQVAWVDSDILINSDSAPNIFDFVPKERVGAVADFRYPSVEQYGRRLALLEDRWRAQGAQVISAATPQEYYRAFGLPELDQVVQTGVLVLSPELHGPLFVRTYASYEDRGSAAYHYEMRPLSYELVSSGLVTWLDPRFNAVLSFGLKDTELDLFTAPYGLIDRVGMRLKIPLSRRQAMLKKIYRGLMSQSYFLHFAGSQHEMFLI